ncbi:hypothetical protein D3C86_1724460 [compost metagenome]
MKQNMMQVITIGAQGGLAFANSADHDANHVHQRQTDQPECGHGSKCGYHFMML